MLAHMVKKVFLTSECLRTKITAVGCFTCMPHDVICEVLLASKTFSTYFAAERRIIRVRAHVVREVLLACILLTTHL